MVVYEGFVARVRYPRDNSGAPLLFAKGIFRRYFYHLDGYPSGCLYISEDNSNTKESLTSVYKDFINAGQMVWYPASGAPCFLLMGMGIHTGFRVNNCDRGFIHIPEELKGIVTAEGLTDVFKKIISPEMSFLLTCDGSPWWMSTRRTALINWCSMPIR